MDTRAIKSYNSSMFPEALNTTKLQLLYLHHANNTRWVQKECFNAWIFYNLKSTTRHKWTLPIQTTPTWRKIVHMKSSSSRKPWLKISMHGNKLVECTRLLVPDPTQIPKAPKQTKKKKKPQQTSTQVLLCGAGTLHSRCAEPYLTESLCQYCII